MYMNIYLFIYIERERLKYHLCWWAPVRLPILSFQFRERERDGLYYTVTVDDTVDFFFFDDVPNDL